MKATYTILLDRERDSRFIASVAGVPGCHAYGKTSAEAVRKVKAALRFYLEDAGVDPDRLRELL